MLTMGLVILKKWFWLIIPNTEIVKNNGVSLLLQNSWIIHMRDWIVPAAQAAINKIFTEARNSLWEGSWHLPSEKSNSKPVYTLCMDPIKTQNLKMTPNKRPRAIELLCLNCIIVGNFPLFSTLLIIYKMTILFESIKTNKSELVSMTKTCHLSWLNEI